MVEIKTHIQPSRGPAPTFVDAGETTYEPLQPGDEHCEVIVWTPKLLPMADKDR